MSAALISLRHRACSGISLERTNWILGQAGVPRRGEGYRQAAGHSG